MGTPASLDERVKYLRLGCVGRKGPGLSGRGVQAGGLGQNRQKRQQITQLFTRGFLDPAIYAQQNDELRKQSEQLTAKKGTITARVSGGDKQKKALEDILHFTARAEMQTEFDEDLFTRFVDRVIVYSRTEIGFAMKCGLTLRERI